LKKWKAALRENDSKLSHKEVLVDQGFLVYVTRIYPAMVLYLKGFHLAIETWQGGQDSKGWKLREMDDSSVNSHQSLGSLDRTRAGAHGLDLDKAATYVPVGGVNEDEDTADLWLGVNPGEGHVHAPVDGLATPTPHFEDDINDLLHLTKFELPPLQVGRPALVVHVYYGFGDASGKQFGATLS
jgi:hypothetical protein